MKNSYPIVHWEMEQRSQEWFDIKNGMMSATGGSDLIGTPAARKKYIQMKAVEGRRHPAMAEDAGPMSADMRRGMELEQYAVAAINEQYQLDNRECGYIEITKHFGISPDWICKDLTMGVEIKCLQPNAEAEVTLSDNIGLERIPKKHRGQVLSYFLVPTIQIVGYAIFIPREEMISGKDMVHITWLHRNDYLGEIADLMNQVIIAGDQIDEYRTRL
jgi:hypothetical protein